MNRAERRRMKVSKSDKVEKAIKNLDPVNFVEAIAEEKFNNQFQKLSLLLNDCTGALLIDLFPNKKLKEITEIQNNLGDMMLEQFRKESKLIEEFGGVEGMKKALEKIEDKVAKEATKLVQKGAKQKESIEILVSKFPKLSKNQLTHAYKQIKEQLKEQEIEQGAEKIMDIIDHKENSKLEKLQDSIANVGEKAKEFNEKFKNGMLERKIKETAKIAAKNIEQMVEESEVIEEPKKVVPEEVKQNRFKPILMKFEGKFATYTKDKSVLKIENDSETKEYTNLEQINQAEQENIKQLEQAILKVKACYEEYRQAFEV